MTEQLVHLVRHIMSQQKDFEKSTKSTQTKPILHQFNISNKKYVTIYQSKKSKNNVFSINLDNKKKTNF